MNEQNNETPTTEAPIDSAPAIETPAVPAEAAASPATKPVGIAALPTKPNAQVPAAPLSPEAQVASAPIAFTPNFKFKSFGKEFEIDEMFRGLIKDTETETKVKSFFERAYGVDTMKSINQKVKEEFSQFKQETAQRDKALETVSGYIQKGDMQSFVEALKIPEDMVIQWAIDRVQYRQLSPDQKAQIDAQHNVRHQAMTLEQQNQNLTERLQQESARARTTELDYELSNPQVKAIADAFDAKVNKPGAFKNLVIREGVVHWQTSQRDLPAKQAIQEVLSNYGMSSPQQNLPQFGTPAAAGANPAPVTTQQNKPTLPNIRGSGTSPVRRVPKTLADLKKIAAQKLAEQ